MIIPCRSKVWFLPVLLWRMSGGYMEHVRIGSNCTDYQKFMR